MKELSGKKVFITGGAKRLGAEIAKVFADCGAELVIHYNDSAQDAERLVKEIIKKGNRACAVKADVREISQIENAVNKGVKFLGGLDILINNAAIFFKTPLIETSESQWNDFLNVNLRAPFFFVKFAAPFLAFGCPTIGCPTLVGEIVPTKVGHPTGERPVAMPLGRIINIADTYGVSPAAGYVPYGVSKAGLIALTKGLAKELAPSVLVNCVCPGVIKEKQEVGSRKQEKAVAASLLKHLISIEDVVNAVLFLAKTESMTGQAIFVDCGRVLSF